MFKKLLAFWHDEEGASLVEYALLLGLIAVVCIATLGFLGTKVDSTLKDVKDKLP